jgi:hypothetical protein
LSTSPQVIWPLKPLGIWANACFAFNLRQMLRPNWQLRAHLGRQHLQRQTTLVALAAQEGGNQSNGMVAPSLNGIDVPKWRWNFDHLNERERPR